MEELTVDRRGQVRRFGLGLVLSLVFHLLLALLVSLWLVEPTRSDEADRGLEVPLEFEPPALPESAPPAAPAEPTPEEAAEQEQEQERALPEDSLLGFASEGDVEGRPDRPVGPEEEIHGMPLPGGAAP
ncbi:MAG: hypothetical protein OEQ13_13165, partial [Acidobacteriota bacterium]|nr:hypothetical protein [Acidobacteriota bacterium]